MSDERTSCHSAEEIVSLELQACQALLLKHDRPGIRDEIHAATEKNVPLRTFDDSRYFIQERALNLAARSEPSLFRFHSLCQTLQGGFRVASRPPVDAKLGDATWIAACLELIAENPLKNHANTWKRTLNLYDRCNIDDSFNGVYLAMTEWVEAVRALEPNSDAEDWGGLVAAIWLHFVEPYAQIEKGRYVARFHEEMILRNGTQGDLQLNDRPLRALCRACTKTEAAAKYREGECPADVFGRVAFMALGWDFHHDARCIECEELVRLTQEFLLSRIDLYNKATDNAMRRAVLTLDPSANRWQDYYLREYCTPTPYHALRASRDMIDARALDELIDAVDYNSASLCDNVYLACGKSENAAKMHNAWGEIRGLFAARCASSATPSYPQQLDFAAKLAAFMQLFNAVLTEIDVKTPPTDAEKAAPDGAKDTDRCPEGQCPLEEKTVPFAVSPRLKKDFIKDVDFEKQTITFKGREPILKRTSMAIRKTAKNKLWKLLVRLITQTDDDGWVTLSKDEANWHGNFRRTAPGDRTRKIVDPTQDPVILFFHVHADKVPGNTGVTKIRLEKRYKEDKYEECRIAYLAWRRKQPKKSSDK